MIAGVLRLHAEEAQAAAEQLAPAGSGPGVRYHVYEGTLDAAKRRLQYQAAFPGGLEELLAPLLCGDHGALELGLELVSRVSPTDVVPVARCLIALEPWKPLWHAIGRALARVDSAQAFELLLAHASDGLAYLGIAMSCFAAGAPAARAKLLAIDKLRSGLIAPSDRVVAESLVSYLGKVGDDDDRALLNDLYRNAQSQLYVAAVRALLWFGDDHAALLEDAIADERYGVRSAAVAASLRRDGATTIDVLGGLDELCSEEGSALAGILLSQLANSPERREADPRCLQLAAAWRTDRRFKDVCARFPLPAPPRRPRLRLEPITPELLASMALLHERLERLVHHLASSGYRFVNRRRALQRPTKASRRAAERIAQELGPLPLVLRAVWEVVGGVDLRGAHPAWPHPANLELPGVHEEGVVWLTDPLVIARPDALLEDVLDGAVPGAPHALAIAPDDDGKAGYSGGLLSIWIPADAADPAIEGGSRAESLVQHIDRALAWGGLPGFESIDDAPSEFIEAAAAVARA